MTTQRSPRPPVEDADLDRAIDAWKVADPSPYFDTRMQARLAEVRQEQQTRKRWVWLGLGVFSTAAAAAVMAVTVGLATPQSTTINVLASAQPKESSTVAVLEEIELYENLELLEDDATFAAAMALAELDDSGPEGG